MIMTMILLESMIFLQNCRLNQLHPLVRELIYQRSPKHFSFIAHVAISLEMLPRLPQPHLKQLKLAVHLLLSTYAINFFNSRLSL
jgi:hypothetical protein